MRHLVLRVTWIFRFISIWTIEKRTVECLKCVQCSSLNDRQCLSGRIAARNCTDDKAGYQYCVTYEGFLKDGTSKLVIRDCSPRMEKTGCRMEEIDGQKVRTCFTSCEDDGCNRGSNPDPRGWTRTTMCLLTLATYILTMILST